MAGQTILQNFIFQDFILPFIFMFVLVFAILEKTKVLGSGKKQLDAIIAGVIALIFVSVAYPKLVVGNLILVLTVAMVLIFVGLLIWGFLIGGDAKITLSEKWMKWVVAILILVFVVIAFFWSAGLNPQVFSFLFEQSWSNTFWVNFIFIVVIAIIIAVALKSSKEGGK